MPPWGIVLIAWGSLLFYCLLVDWKGDVMPPKEYDHWNEEASIVWAAENRDAMERGDPAADMTDEEIKQRVYDRMADGDDWEEGGH